MKKITLLTFLLITMVGFSQSLPLDFEVPEDNTWGSFNGASANVVVDPTDATNQVLELVGNGAPFDGAAITLDTYIDLSDDNNNTITLRIWAPDANSRTHLLKIEGGTSAPAATELTFSTTVAGWQNISVDFGPGLISEYPILVLFPDFNNGDVGTYYIDDIDGPNGAVIPTVELPATPAPTPTTPNAEVLMLFGDTGGYTNNWVSDYSFGTRNLVDLGTSPDVNQAIQMNFSVAGWGAGTNATTNISSYGWVHFDYYADSTFPAGVNGEQVLFILIDNDGVVQEFNYELKPTGGDGVLVFDSWQGVDIPLSFFVNKGFDINNFFQYKLGTTSDLNSKIVYFDNIYFSQNQALSLNEMTLTDFRVFPNPSNLKWNVEANSTIKSISFVNVLGKQVLRLEPNSSSFSIDNTSLATGLYFATIATENGSSVVKLIKN